MGKGRGRGGGRAGIEHPQERGDIGAYAVVPGLAHPIGLEGSKVLRALVASEIAAIPPLTT